MLIVLIIFLLIDAIFFLIYNRKVKNAYKQEPHIFMYVDQMIRAEAYLFLAVIIAVHVATFGIRGPNHLEENHLIVNIIYTIIEFLYIGRRFQLINKHFKK